jgi:hypothetical protein
VQKKTVDGSVCVCVCVCECVCVCVFVCVYGFDLGGCTPLGVYVSRCMFVFVYVHARTPEGEARSHGG